MRITFLGNFRVDFSSETHHKKSLEALGHKVIALQESEATSQDILREASLSQLFVWVHTHGWMTPGVPHMNAILKLLKQRGVLTVTYHLDLWFGLQRQKDLKTDKFYENIQHFFTADKLMADWFNEHTQVKGHYLPAGVFGEECYMDNSLPIKNDVVFVGSRRYHSEWPYRRQLIDWLRATYGNRFKHYGHDGLGVIRGKELNALYGQTRVVVGDSLCINFDYPYYWSDRLYETIGRGGFLIFPQIKGITQEVSSGKHVRLYEYGNFKQLKYFIDYYIKNDEEREKIRVAGFEHVKNRYTYRDRWQQILRELGFDAKEWNGYYAPKSA